MTIVAPTPERLQQVADMIRTTCVARDKMGILKDSGTVPGFNENYQGCGYSGVNLVISEMARSANKDLKDDACGFSMWNFVVRLPNGRPAEIQVNVPELIYGKQKKETAIKQIGAEKWAEINARFQIEGGLGHTLYEIYRAAPASEIGKLAASVSRQYNCYLRGYYNPQLRIKLIAAINDIKRKAPDKFHH
jgi:hypothetical protein